MTTTQASRGFSSGSSRRMRMYNDPTTSDVIIYFGGRSVHAHKAILSEHSEVYRAFYGPWAKTSYTIPCEEYDIQAIESLLKHIYSFPYEEPINIEVDLNWYLQLYLIAVECWADSFETKVLELIEADVFLIYDRQEFKDCCRQIEELYNSNVLPMSLFDTMDDYIHASNKYLVDKQEIVEEKERMRKQRRDAEDRFRRDRSTCLKSGKDGERDEADRIMLGLGEVLARLSMADREQQDHEKKMRRLAHPGRLRFQMDREEKN
ncbi:hypothetical protein KCU65_g1978, partial [Aureobasidium melanogenum]